MWRRQSAGARGPVRVGSIHACAVSGRCTLNLRLRGDKFRAFLRTSQYHTPQLRLYAV